MPSRFVAADIHSDEEETESADERNPLQEELRDDDEFEKMLAKARDSLANSTTPLRTNASRSFRTPLEPHNNNDISSIHHHETPALQLFDSPQRSTRNGSRSANGTRSNTEELEELISTLRLKVKEQQKQIDRLTAENELLLRNQSRPVGMNTGSNIEQELRSLRREVERLRVDEERQRYPPQPYSTPPRRKYRPQVSPGYKFVADLSRVMDLPPSSRTHLSEIMDRQLERFANDRGDYSHNYYH